MNPRIFSEKEASEILQRAAKLQETSADGSYTPGVTIDELARIATEAGIDRKYLEAALTAPTSASVKTSLLNLIEEHELVIDGELDAEGLAELVDELRQVSKVRMVSAVGNSCQGVVSKGTAYGEFQVSSRRGRTRIRLKQTPFVAYFMGLHVPLILSLALGANFAAHGLVWPALFGALGLFIAGCGAFYYLAKRGKEQARQLFATIGERLREVLSLKTHTAQSANETAVQEQDDMLQNRLT